MTEAEFLGVDPSERIVLRPEGRLWLASLIPATGPSPIFERMKSDGQES